MQISVILINWQTIDSPSYLDVQVKVLALIFDLNKMHSIFLSDI